MVAVIALPLAAGAQTIGPTQKWEVRALEWNTPLPEGMQGRLLLERQALVGKSITLKDLASVLERLSQQERDAGFVLANISLTQGSLNTFVRTGVLTLAVFPGKVSEIRLKNTSRVNDERLRRTAEGAMCPQGLGEQCIVTAERLERMALLLQDLPGVKFQTPGVDPAGADVGMTNLVVTTEPDPQRRLISGGGTVDNFGYPAGGTYRAGVNLLVTNLFEFGDIIAFAGSITNKGAFTGTLQLSGPLQYSGFRWQAGYTRAQFAVAETNTVGISDGFSLGVLHPFVRSLDRNLNLTIDGWFSESRQLVAGIQAFPPRDLYGARLAVAADSGDRSIMTGGHFWSGKGILTAGAVSQALTAPDLPGVIGNYGKFSTDWVGKWDLGSSGLSAIGNFRAQAATRNLDGSEKQAIGGAGAVRAYPSEEGGLDAAALLRVELRRNFRLPNNDVISPGILLDALAGAYNTIPYANWQLNAGLSDLTLPNARMWAATGLGLDFASHKGVFLSAFWSIMLPGSPPSVVYPSETNRFWAVLSARF